MPVCYQPMTLTLNIRGGGDDDDDDDDEDDEDDGDGAERKRGGGAAAAKAVATIEPAAAKAVKAKPPKGAAGGDDDDDNAPTCIVCFERGRNAMLMPCGHMFTCSECVAQLRQRECPVCRTRIERVTKVGDAGGGAATTNAKLGRKNLLQKLDVADFQSSTKVEAVAAAVREMMRATTRRRPGAAPGRVAGSDAGAARPRGR